jgi:hypothetical protein
VNTTIQFNYTAKLGWILTNYPKFLLPMAGSTGANSYLFFGLGTVMAAILLLFTSAWVWNKKKNKEEFMK